MATLKDFSLDTLIRLGPNHVLVNTWGVGVGAKYAKHRHGIIADIYFIRRDLYVLGSPYLWRKHAYAMFPDEWIGFHVRGTKLVQPISEYINLVV